MRVLIVLLFASLLSPAVLHAVPPGPSGGLGEAPERFEHAARSLRAEGWSVRTAPDRPFRMTALGPGIAVRSDGTEELRAFVSARADLPAPGVRVEDLRAEAPRVAGEVSGITLRQTKDGVPVVGGHVWGRVKMGRLVAVGVETEPVADVRTSPVLAAEQVAAAWLAEHPGGQIERGPELMILPERLSGSGEARAVWAFEVRDRSDPLRPVWEFRYADAETGALLWRQNLVRHISGTVSARHEARTIGDPDVDSPMSWLRLRITGPDTYADVDGFYDTGASTSQVELRVESRHITVFNEAGADSRLNTTGGALVWTPADAERAELSAYVFIHEAWDFARTLSPGLPWLQDGYVETYVNMNDVCNAYFDGTWAFFAAGGPCNNTGRIADVVYHEFGHAYHYYSMESVGMAGQFDVALSEGLSDYLACTMTGDPDMGPFFFTDGGGVRRCDTDARWPDDIDQDPHLTGLIISGALWDLRELLMAKYGAADGIAAADRVFAGLLPFSVDIPSTWEEALIADDDNGNLADGTPNFCEISDAFAAHGLGEGSATGGGISHVPLLIQDVSLDAYPVDAAVSFAACDASRVGEAVVVWETDEDSGRVDAELSGGVVTGLIPRAAPGASVRYRIEVTDRAAGDVLRLPSPEETEEWYRFRVGPLAEIWCDDLENGEGEWTHRLTAGQDQQGADDWQLGAPAGRADDPDFAHNGNHVWANDLGQENWNGEYQPEKRNELTSPPISTTGFKDVHLIYRRWLNVEDGLYDHARIYVNDVPVWENAASDSGEEHHMDRHWFFHDLDISDLADDLDEVRIRFELESDQGLQMGGWTIDDVCLYSLDPELLPDPPEDDDISENLVDDGPAVIWRSGCACSGMGGGGGASGAVFLLALGASLVGRSRRR